MLDTHAFEAQAGVLTATMTQVAAARELYATVVPRLKDLVRTSRTDLILEPLVRMAALAELVGEEEAAFADAVRRKALMLDGTASTRDRANIIAGLVELGERSRQVLEHYFSEAPRHLRCQ